MRLRFFPNASRLGFGCASLGSRVGRVKGLNTWENMHRLPRSSCLARRHLYLRHR
jgi:hypothetical protein